MISKYEVLAPAGTLDDLKKMLMEQPDAIYVGLVGFSSRPEFADMTMEEIEQAVKLCHEANVRLYVAINANVVNSHVDSIIDSILLMDQWKVDAVILSEMGIVCELKGKLNHMAIHASTLMGVYNIDTVKLLKSMGVTRIIFYTNMYFDEIALITQAFPELEYELVAEGGTCFNDIRRCNLPHVYEDDVHKLFCRFKYLIEKNSGTSEVSMLAKEISEYSTRTAEIVGIYMAIGIMSFKIEGRTLPAQERIPMVRDLKKYIAMYEQNDTLKSYLHYFFRRNREMR